MSRASKTVASPRRYHHGDLREALLIAAEQTLIEDGLPGLKLRAIARRAGVSHTAADPHFGDLTGLLSELAAIGFDRFKGSMMAQGRDPKAIGQGYVAFAIAQPQMFMLMFRSDLLDFDRPRLRQAADAAGALLGAAVGATGERKAAMSLPDAARRAAAWSLVHGLAMLIIDHRLAPLMDGVEPRPDVEAMIQATLEAVSFR